MRRDDGDGTGRYRRKQDGISIFFLLESGLTLAADARAKPPRVMLRSDWSLRRGASVATSEGQTKITLLRVATFNPPPRRRVAAVAEEKLSRPEFEARESRKRIRDFLKKPTCNVTAIFLEDKSCSSPIVD